MRSSTPSSAPRPTASRPTSRDGAVATRAAPEIAEAAADGLAGITAIDLGPDGLVTRITSTYDSRQLVGGDERLLGDVAVGDQLGRQGHRRRTGRDAAAPGPGCRPAVWYI